MDRREFLKITGIMAVSVPVFGMAKNVVAPVEKVVPECCPHEQPTKRELLAMLFVNGVPYKTIILHYPVQRYDEYVPREVSPVFHRGDEAIACDPWPRATFNFTEIGYTVFGCQYAKYHCNDPQFFVRSDGELHKHGRLA